MSMPLLPSSHPNLVVAYTTADGKVMVDNNINVGGKLTSQPTTFKTETVQIKGAI